MKDKLKKLTFARLLMAMTSTAAFAEVLTDSSDDVVWGHSTHYYTFSCLM